MRFSFSTGTFYYRNLSWCLRLAEQAGFDGVEYVIGPDYFIRGEAALARVARADPGRVLSLHPPFTLFSRLPGVPWPKRGIGSWPRTMRVAAALGVPMAVTHTVSIYSWESPRAEHYLAALKQGREAAPQVELTIESAQRGRRRASLLDDLRTLVDLAQTQGCGITLDTCHAGYNGDDLFAAYELVRPLLRNVHLSDIHRTPDGIERHVPPGAGDLPLAELMARLARDGYDGLVTLEVDPRALGMRGSVAPVRPMRELLDWLRATTGQP